MTHHVSTRGRIAKLAALIAVAVVGIMITASTADAFPDPDKFNWTNFDYDGKNVDGEAYQKGDTAMSPPMLLMLMNFAIVLIIIGWKIRPPVSKYVKGRHESIKEQLDKATELRNEAQEKLDLYSSKLAEAEAEVDKIISDIRAAAESEKKRIMADAEAQAASMKKDAETRIAAEIARAREQLEHEIIAAATAAAETMLREQATPKDHTALIDTFISDMWTQAKASTQEHT